VARDPKAIRDLLRVIDEHLRFLTSNRNRLRRQVAAAGLVRCRNLVEGMLILREGGRADILGILNRAVLEAWLVSLWVLLKGQDLDDDSVLIDLPLLEREGSRINALEVYNRAYRGESTASVHAGLGTIHRYLRYGNEEAGEPDSLTCDPGPAFPDQEWLAAILTFSLAEHVFGAFGVKVEPPLRQLYEPLKRRVEVIGEGPRA
jgi:hypothetical protein